MNKKTTNSEISVKSKKISWKSYDFNTKFNDIIVDEKLKKLISNLPRDIQKKIYICTWRNFWRSYVPLTAKIPMWYKYKIDNEKILHDARMNNIHFMHLPFNIITENKKWIMGCQCSYCVNYESNNELECNLEYAKQYENSNYFQSIMPSTDSSNWNDTYYFITNNDNEYPMAGYDPLYGSEFENYEKWAIRENISMKFSDYT